MFFNLSQMSFILWVAASPIAFGQGPSPTTVNAPAAAPSSYVLGADDQLVIHASPANDIPDKPFQIGPDGLISLPLIGTVQAAGLTTRQLENEIASKLNDYVQNPRVSITVTEYRSEPVSVLGEVNTAGVQQLRGETRLMQVLSSAGGLKTDAGYSIRIVRRSEYGPLPLPGSALDEQGKFYIAQLNIKDVLNAHRPQDDIVVKPYDVITVPRAEMIYVVGEVNTAGAFVLNEQKSISILQAIARAGGLKATAAAKNVRILRPVSNTSEKTEIQVNVARILRGSDPDVPLYTDDVLFIPNNVNRNVALRTLETMVNVGSGVAIWRLP